jgi:hypothetical protein
MIPDQQPSQQFARPAACPEWLSERVALALTIASFVVVMAILWVRL